MTFIFFEKDTTSDYSLFPSCLPRAYVFSCASLLPAQKQKYRYQMVSNGHLTFVNGVSFHPFNPNHLPAPRAPLESRKDAKVRPVVVACCRGRASRSLARWCIMRYTGITGIIRITCITSIIRTYVRPRWNRPGTTASSFSDSLFAPPAPLVSPRLPPYILISPHPPFRPSSSIPSSSSYSPRLSLSLSYSPLPLLSYLFTLRPRASGRFNVRDFFSPSLVPAPFSLLLLVRHLGFDHLSSLRSCTPARFATFARAAMRLLCNRAPRSAKLRIVIFVTTRSSFISNFSLKNRDSVTSF